MSNLIEKDLAQRTAERYEKEGYKIFFEPNPSLIPFDLGNYRPDLLAMKAINDGYIFEFKSSKSKISVDELKEIASSTDSNEGWHFVLVTGDDITVQEPEIDSKKLLLDWDQILAEIEKSKKLLKLNEEESTFLILMRIIEAILRKHSDEKSIPIELLPLTTIVNHLYSLGELSFEQFDSIRKLQKIRNQLTHGFQMQLKKSDINQAYSLIDELLETYKSN